MCCEIFQGLGCIISESKECLSQMSVTYSHPYRHQSHPPGIQGQVRAHDTMAVPQRLRLHRLAAIGETFCLPSPSHAFSNQNAWIAFPQSSHLPLSRGQVTLPPGQLRNRVPDKKEKKQKSHP